MSICTISGSHVHFICNDDDRAAPAGVSEAAVAEDATWLRALLAAELDTALGPEGLRMPGAIAGALGQLVADGTLVRAPGGPDSPLLRLAQRSDGARCEAGPFEGMAGGMREEDGNANRSGLLVVKLQRASGMARLRACQHPNAVHAAVPGMGAGIWQGLFALSCLASMTTIRGHRPCATQDVRHAMQGGGVRRVAARAAAGDVLHGAAAGRGRAAAGARRHAARQEAAALHPGPPYIPTPSI